MDVLANHDKEENNAEPGDCINEKVCKTKTYILRANWNYKQKRLIIDEEYKTRINESKKKYREKNKDKYNERQRLYMREYRAKKKAEAASSTPASKAQPEVETDDVINALEGLTLT